MKRNIYFRVLILVLATSVSVLLFSYVHARSSSSEEQQPCNEGGKCNRENKAKTEIILWESLTHNLLATNR
jgi:hypothetical protein